MGVGQSARAQFSFEEAETSGPTLSVCLSVQLYPGGGPVVKLMETLSDWLLSLPLQRIPYQAVLDLVDNKMRVRHTHAHLALTRAPNPDLERPFQCVTTSQNVLTTLVLRWFPVSCPDLRRVPGGGASLGWLPGQ